MKSNKGFNLLSVIIIICITSIISGITTGVIVTNTYKSSTGLTYNELLNDEKLNEFLEVYSSVANNYYEDVDTSEMIDTALDAMLEYLGDSYTTYLDDEQTKKLEESLSGVYRGIGIAFQMDTTTNAPTITSVTKSSPAESAGLLVGDILVSVDGTNISGKTSNEIQNMIRNSSKDSVNLVISRNGTEMAFDVAIKSVQDVNIGYELINGTNIFLDKSITYLWVIGSLSLFPVSKNPLQFKIFPFLKQIETFILYLILLLYLFNSLIYKNNIIGASIIKTI